MNAPGSSTGPPEVLQGVAFNFADFKAKGLVAREYEVRNARRLERPLRLKGDGVELVEIDYPDDFPFSDLGKLLNRHRAVLPAVARRLIGGLSEVFVLPPLWRSEAPSNSIGKEHTRAHHFVHNDFSAGFEDWLRDLALNDPTALRGYLTLPIAVDQIALAQRVLSAKRIVVLQFWGSALPVGTLLELNPLAICLPRSVRPEDCQPYPLPRYGNTKHVDGFYVVAGRPGQLEWVWWPQLARGEALCWVGYDSANHRAFTPPLHSAFSVPPQFQRPGALPRESWEGRVVCLVDHDEPLIPIYSERGRL